MLFRSKAEWTGPTGERCSRCGQYGYYKHRPPYCPNCGARMVNGTPISNKTRLNKDDIWFSLFGGKRR